MQEQKDLHINRRHVLGGYKLLRNGLLSMDEVWHRWHGFSVAVADGHLFTLNGSVRGYVALSTEIKDGSRRVFGYYDDGVVGVEPRHKRGFQGTWVDRGDVEVALSRR